jgi:hypothetical protein
MRRLALIALLALASLHPAQAKHGQDRASTVAIAPLPQTADRAGLPGLLLEGGAGTQPLVLLVADHLGADHRTWFHAEALLHAGLDVLVLEPPADRAEGMLDALFAALAAARDGTGELGRRARVGLFGLGTGGEATLLAAFEHAAARRLGEGGSRFDGHVALYPTCGPDLARALAAEPPLPPTGAPVLIVQPWPEQVPGQGGWDCSALTSDAASEGRDERVTVRRFDWTGYGFDLEPNSPRHVLPHPTGEGALVAVPEPGAAELARRDITFFLWSALVR